MAKAMKGSATGQMRTEGDEDGQKQMAAAFDPVQKKPDPRIVALARLLGRNAARQYFRDNGAANDHIE